MIQNSCNLGNNSICSIYLILTDNRYFNLLMKKQSKFTVSYLKTISNIITNSLNNYKH